MPLQPLEGLRQDLSQIQKALVEARMLPFSAEMQHSFLASAQQLGDRLESLTQDRLTVGLLGGTGVGKSTIMNALAGAPIASTDHRRPHTDRVLIYHFAGEPLPAAVAESNVPRREFVHEALDIRHIILCDLPDFDSLLTGNRELVLEFLEQLDLLIWVTSPEKYADARFYEFLTLVPKARENFLFVLNKMDLLFPGESRPEPTSPGVGREAVPVGPSDVKAGMDAVSAGSNDAASGYGALERLINRFREHVIRHGIEQPLIYAVSAGQVAAGGPPGPWNQFAALRRHVFQQRAVKEIVAIKSANLDEEIQRLVETVRGELQVLARAVPAIERLIAELSDGAAESVAAGRLVLDRWIQVELSRQLERNLSAPSLLLGPGRVLEALQRAWNVWQRDPQYGGTYGGALTAASPLPEDLVNRLRGELLHTEHRLANALLRQALPTGVSKALVQSAGLEAAWEQFAARVRNAVESRLLAPAEPRRSWPTTMFRLRQYLAYAVLVAMFLLVEGGEGLWMRVVERPSLRTLATLVMSIFNSLFSPSGLAALATLAILLLLLAARFRGRYKKLLQQQTQKIIDSLKSEAGSHWEALIHQVIEDLTRVQHELQQPFEAFSRMRREPLGE